MKGLVLTLFFIMFDYSLAAKEAKPSAAGKASTLHYFEVVPKIVTELKISPSADCGGIATRQYEAYEQLQSAEASKMVPVRVLSIYATCLHQTSNKNVTTLKFPSDDKHMTHVYITAEQGLKIQWN